MTNEPPDDLIQKYHAGTLSRDEMHQLNEWFNSFDDTQTHATTSEDILKERILASARQQIARHETLPRRQLYRGYWRMAAAVLVLVTAGIMTYVKRTAIWNVLDPVVYREIQTPAGSVRKVALADGTQIWLNAATSLRYPERFNRGTREIFVKGEAFLEVKENTEKPFIVHLSDLDVRVTGTSFQVKDYTGDDEATVTLRSGSVTVSQFRGGNGVEKVLGRLTPDQQLIFHKHTQAIEQETVNARDNFHWTEGVLRFENRPLGEIMQALGHWYGVRFVLQGEGLAECRFKMNLTGVPLSEALAIIGELTNTKYIRQGTIIQFIGKGCK